MRSVLVAPEDLHAILMLLRAVVEAVLPILVELLVKSVGKKMPIVMAPARAKTAAREAFGNVLNILLQVFLYRVGFVPQHCGCNPGVEVAISEVQH